MLEDVALSRAVDHSDALMVFLLKGRRPAKFADRKLSGTMGSDGNVTQLNDTERAVKLVNLITKAAQSAELPPALQELAEKMAPVTTIEVENDN